MARGLAINFQFSGIFTTRQSLVGKRKHYWVALLFFNCFNRRLGSQDQHITVHFRAIVGKVAAMPPSHPLARREIFFLGTFTTAENEQLTALTVLPFYITHCCQDTAVATHGSHKN